MEITGDVYLWSVHEWKIDHLFCVNVDFIVKYMYLYIKLHITEESKKPCMWMIYYACTIKLKIKLVAFAVKGRLYFSNTCSSCKICFYHRRVL